VLALQQDAEDATLARTKMNAAAVNVRIAEGELRQWIGDAALMRDDEILQEARLVTADVAVDRARLAATDAERMLAHQEAGRQRAWTRNNTIATLALTVVVGAATFAALAGSTEMKVAIGVLAGTLFGSLGYQLALGAQGTCGIRTWLAVGALAGSVAAVLVAFNAGMATGWLATVGAVGNALGIIWYCRLTPGCGQPRPGDD
jgi:hypothetical protein